MHNKTFIALLGTAVLLAGCGSTKLLGSKDLPDETQVVDGPGLVLPPDYDLRPPRKADDYEAALRAQKSLETQTLITGVSATTVVSGSTAEDAWLLKQTGGVAQPGIRQELVSDDKVEEKKQQKDQGLLQRWFGGHKSDDGE